MPRLGVLLRVAPVVLLLLSNRPPAYAQASFLYKVILGGAVVLVTTNAAKAYDYMTGHPGSKVVQQEKAKPKGQKSPPDEDDDDDDDSDDTNK